MTINSGNALTRDKIAEVFRDAMTNAANSSIQWTLESNPFLSNHPVGAEITSTSWGSLTDVPVSSGSTISTGPNGVDLSTGTVSAVNILFVMSLYMQLFSRAKTVRLAKYFNNEGNLQLLYNNAAVVHGDPTVAPSLQTTDNLLSNADIQQNKETLPIHLNNLAAFAGLYLSLWRSQELLFTEIWCHNQCHSDHSNRSRR